MDGEPKVDPKTSRRVFLGRGLLGGAALAVAPPLFAGVAAEPEATGASPPVAGAGGPASPAAPASPASPAASGPAEDGFDLAEVTIAELQAGLAAGRWTSRRLVEAYLARIAALDRRGPALRAVLEVNPEALAIADALDAERQAKGARGPLHGVPILLKDNIGTHDRMTTTAGSLALAGSVPASDAWVVRRLREAGAVLLGKANMSEWANFRSSRSSSGWSCRGGQCRNPYVLDRSPSGSSSGSAAAVAANLCAAAVGTETDGSIVSPAGHCALVGIKPTVGLLSRSGIVRCGGGRVSQHHGAGGGGIRPAGRHLFFRCRLERADADPARIRLRASHPASPAAALPGNRRAAGRGGGRRPGAAGEQRLRLTRGWFLGGLGRRSC